MFGNLKDEDIEKVIHGNIVGRIGCHSKGKTYVVPISYAYDGAFLYFHTYEGMMINMLRENPEACFQVDIMENMGHWQSVIAWGTFEELTEAGERSVGLEKLTQRIVPHLASETVKLYPQWPFPPDDLKKIKGIVFRIRLSEKSGRFERMDTQMK
jgi:uncharacterized protein